MCQRGELASRHQSLGIQNFDLLTAKMAGSDCQSDTSNVACLLDISESKAESASRLQLDLISIKSYTEARGRTVQVRSNGILEAACFDLQSSAIRKNHLRD